MNTRNSFVKVFAFFLLVTLAVPLRAAPENNATIPGEVAATTTMVCAGLEWQISGDYNLNCAVSVAFREKGEDKWRDAQPLLRCEPGDINLYKDSYPATVWTKENCLAGSIFFLSPGTTYEVLLRLKDPDGGEAEKTVAVTTRTEPQACENGRTLYVAPGQGGGSGKQADPFKGLDAADAAAEPGDVFVLMPGTYAGPFKATKDGTPERPIVYRGQDADKVILEAGVPKRPGTVDLSRRKYLFLENVTITNASAGVYASNAEGIVIRGCKIVPAKDSSPRPIAINAMGNESRNFFIADNTILMSGNWENKGRDVNDGYGIRINGSGHIICYNHIMEAWDLISLDSSVGSVANKGMKTSDIDIYNNILERGNDDAVEADSVLHNIRVFRNRILNSGCAVSCQTCFGGPTYSIYNEMLNCRIKPYKYHIVRNDPINDQYPVPTGMIAFHNTSVASRLGWGGSGFRNARHYNNLLLGNLAPTVSFSAVGIVFDHNGYNRVGEVLLKINEASYKTLAEFAAATGNEKHGIEVTIEDFVKAELPHHPEYTYKTHKGWGRPYLADEIDLRLKPESKAVDAGAVLANINEDFTGNAPDLGCYELGKPLPHYGPRQKPPEKP